GATHTCTSWLSVASGYSGGAVLTPGGRPPAYYPPRRPAAGVVWGWAAGRGPPLLFAPGAPAAPGGPAPPFFPLSPRPPPGGLRRFARWAAKALAVWLACVLLGAAGGLLLLRSNRDLLAMLVGPIAGGVLGGWLALRDAWYASRSGPNSAGSVVR